MPSDETTILVVEDDPGVRRVLTSILRRATSLAVDDFGSGAEALECARLRSYGIAVLDVDMSPMDGLELATELEALQPGLPIVFLTGSIGTDRVRAQARDPAAVLQKPADIRSIGEVVLEHVLRAK